MMKSIVAARGFIADFLIENMSFEITQFEPFDLTGFTEDQIKNSNLQTLLDNGWVVEYTGQELPKNPKTKAVPKIPSVNSEEKPDLIKFSQEKEGSRVVTHVDIPEDLPADIQKRLQKAVKADAAKKKQELAKLKGESDTKEVIKPAKLTAKDLKRTLIVDGKQVDDFNFLGDATNEKPKN